MIFCERGIAVDGVFPDLESVGAKIDFGIGIAVQDSGLFGEQVAHGLLVAVVLKERFVGANDFLVFLEPLANTGAKANDPLYAISRKKAVAEDSFRFLADTIHTTGPLDQPDDRPGQIEIHDDGPVLKVLAFGKHIRGDQDVNFLFGGNFLRFSFATGLNRQAIWVGSSLSPVTAASLRMPRH